MNNPRRQHQIKTPREVEGLNFFANKKQNDSGTFDYYVC